jgi:hypothetical protein
MLPFFIYFALFFKKDITKTVAVACAVLVSQLFILSFNGFLVPDFLSVMRHNPIASYALDNYPSLYNPTPEIFVDRTNHTDLSFPTTAVYKKNGICRKAFVLGHERNTLMAECGFIPEKYGKMFEETYTAKSDSPFRIKTIEMIITPDDKICTQSPGKNCLRTVADIMKATGIRDVKRIHNTYAYGGWAVDWGLPFMFTVMPGYTVSYYSFEGFYVNY